MKFSFLILTLSIFNFNLMAEGKKPARSLDIDPFDSSTKAAPSNKEVGPKVLAIVENGDKVSAFELDALDKRLAGKEVDKLSNEEKFKALDSILLQTEKEGKELKLVSVSKRSLDQDEATSACLRRRASTSGSTVSYQPVVATTANGSTVYYYQTTTRTRWTSTPAVQYQQTTPATPNPIPASKPDPAPTPDPNYYRPGSEFNTNPATPNAEPKKTSQEETPAPQPQQVVYNTQYTCTTTVMMPSGRIVRYYYR